MLKFFIGILLVLWVKDGITQIPTFDFFLNSGVSESMSYAFEYPNDNYYFCGNRKIDSTSWEYGVMIFRSDQFGDTTMHFYCLQDTSITISFLISTVNNIIGFGIYETEGKVINEGLINLIFDFDLNLISKKVFPFPSEYESAWSSVDDILVDQGGNFISIFTLKEFESKQLTDGGDICFYKFNMDGDTISTKLLKLESSQSVDAACFNADTTEIWVFGDGFTMSPKQWVKFDLSYNLISIDDFHYDAGYPFSVIKESSESWLGCGKFFNTTNRSDFDLWTFRMDSSGYILNDTILGTIDTNEYTSFGRAVARDIDGNIYISGTHNVTVGFFPNVKSWISLTKLDSQFNHEFTRYYNPDDKYYLNFDIKACSDGGILLCNLRYDSDDNTTPPLNFDAWVLKVDNNGLMTGINDGSDFEIQNVLIFPNPGNSNINIVSPWTNSTLNLYTRNGILILSKELHQINTIVNTANLASGVYFWTVYQNNNKLIESGKWIKN